MPSLNLLFCDKNDKVLEEKSINGNCQFKTSIDDSLVYKIRIKSKTPLELYMTINGFTVYTRYVGLGFHQEELVEMKEWYRRNLPNNYLYRIEIKRLMAVSAIKRELEKHYNNAETSEDEDE